MLILPEVFEALGSHFRVPDRVVDVSMPQVVLDGAGIVSLGSEKVAAGMPELMGMDREVKARRLPSASEDVPNRSRRERRPPLRYKYVG